MKAVRGESEKGQISCPATQSTQHDHFIAKYSMISCQLIAGSLKYTRSAGWWYQSLESEKIMLKR